MDADRPFALLPLRPASGDPGAERFLPPPGCVPVDVVPVEIPAGRTVAPSAGIPGHPDAGLAVVLRGTLALSVRCAGGGGAVVDILGPGDPVGLDVFDAPRRTGWAGECATALVRSRILPVPASSLEAAVGRDPGVAAWAVAAVARRSRHAIDRLARALSMPVQERVAAELRGIARRHGRRCDGGWRLDVPITQDLLASLVGATRESVNRAIRRLCERDQVRRIGRCYVVLDGGSEGVPFDRAAGLADLAGAADRRFGARAGVAR